MKSSYKSTLLSINIVKKFGKNIPLTRFETGTYTLGVIRFYHHAVRPERKTIKMIIIASILKQKSALVL
jgi:hypothetical protein